MGLGATPKDWKHFVETFGAENLLPVVSDPNVQISPRSKMKGLGKTPSLINAEGHAVGFTGWPGHEATPKQIERWSRDDRLGISVITRRFRALDVDVPDVRLADDVVGTFLNAAGVASLPTRTRPGTGKRLLVFRILDDPPLQKRVIKIHGGLVEFLADGQQFVAVGTHTSGRRYEWPDGPPEEAVITLAQHEAGWGAVATKFGVEPERRAVDRKPRAGGEASGSAVPDPVADWLLANWPTFGEHKGKVLVECPWKGAHTGDSGETETAWLIAGTGGAEQGHFRCLHAHCQNRDDADFLEATGYRRSLFEDQDEADAREAMKDPDPAAAKRALALANTPLPGFEREDSGRCKASLFNLVEALGAAQACGYEIRFDDFRGALMIRRPDDVWREFRDADAVAIRMGLERSKALKFKPIGKEMMRDAITLVSDTQRFDSAIAWLESLPPWDGKERIDAFFPRYFGAADTPYTQAVGMYVWTALAARVMQAGCKVDMIPVLAGPQGVGKSTGIRAIAPAEQMFETLNLHDKADDLARKMRGVMVGELDELRGLNSREAEWIKSWVTTTTDKWVPKYVEHAVAYPRRIVLFGTTNRQDFLADETGERRWLPMLCRQVDVKAIIRDRDQLWAEGLHEWRRLGVCWQGAEKLARAEHAAFRASDPWEEEINNWLNTPDLLDGSVPADSAAITTRKVLKEALRLDTGRCGRAESNRVARVMRSLGYSDRVKKIGGTSARAWSVTAGRQQVTIGS